MKIITWNMRRARDTSPAWQIMLDLYPDIALLQEVKEFPENIKKDYSILSRNAVRRNGKAQSFSIIVMVKGEIINEISLGSEYEWINNELKFFHGNFVACTVKPRGEEELNVVSVYSPAWPVDTSKYPGVDVFSIKLTQNPKLWPTEILWSALKNTVDRKDAWIIGGDFNSSETFDVPYQLEHGIKGGIVSNGNKEIRERMYALGFKECLREFNGSLIPTYKHTNQQILHQIDHLYVTDNLYTKVNDCRVGDNVIFEKGLSDHLPIIAEFGVK